ncbi:hypothetical protein M9Y10_042196 [Tritrichomonas musculus]|uniref:Uncharacterized protein n=1 Tax=Tritrichomonas musculus TaxID=1915356 RepID=A0ABR2K7B7_9EUKA
MSSSNSSDVEEVHEDVDDVHDVEDGQNKQPSDDDETTQPKKEEYHAPKQGHKDDTYKQVDAPRINLREKLVATRNHFVYDDDIEELSK